MRKFTAILLVFLYSVANTGFAAQLSLCGDALVSISFTLDEDEECCLCPVQPEEDACCKTEEFIIKAGTKEHQAVKSFPTLACPVFSGHTSVLPAHTHISLNPVLQSGSWSPPDCRLLNCVFII